MANVVFNAAREHARQAAFLTLDNSTLDDAYAEHVMAKHPEAVPALNRLVAALEVAELAGDARFQMMVERPGLVGLDGGVGAVLYEAWRSA